MMTFFFFSSLGISIQLWREVQKVSKNVCAVLQRSIFDWFTKKAESFLRGVQMWVRGTLETSTFTARDSLNFHWIFMALNLFFFCSQTCIHSHRYKKNSGVDSHARGWCEFVSTTGLVWFSGGFGTTLDHLTKICPGRRNKVLFSFSAQPQVSLRFPPF